MPRIQNFKQSQSNQLLNFLTENQCENSTAKQADKRDSIYYFNYSQLDFLPPAKKSRDVIHNEKGFERIYEIKQEELKEELALYCNKKFVTTLKHKYKASVKYFINRANIGQAIDDIEPFLVAQDSICKTKDKLYYGPANFIKNNNWTLFDSSARVETARSFLKKKLQLAYIENDQKNELSKFFHDRSNSQLNFIERLSDSVNGNLIQKEYLVQITMDVATALYVKSGMHHEFSILTALECASQLSDETQTVYRYNNFARLDSGWVEYGEMHINAGMGGPAIYTEDVNPMLRSKYENTRKFFIKKSSANLCLEAAKKIAEILKKDVEIKNEFEKIKRLKQMQMSFNNSAKILDRGNNKLYSNESSIFSNTFHNKLIIYPFLWAAKLDKFLLIKMIESLSIDGYDYSDYILDKMKVFQLPIDGVDELKEVLDEMDNPILSIDKNNESKKVFDEIHDAQSSVQKIHIAHYIFEKALKHFERINSKKEIMHIKATEIAQEAMEVIDKVLLEANECLDIAWEGFWQAIRNTQIKLKKLQENIKNIKNIENNGNLEKVQFLFSNANKLAMLLEDIRKVRVYRNVHFNIKTAVSEVKRKTLDEAIAEQEKAKNSVKDAVRETGEALAAVIKYEAHQQASQNALELTQRNIKIAEEEIKNITETLKESQKNMENILLAEKQILKKMQENNKILKKLQKDKIAALKANEVAQENLKKAQDYLRETELRSSTASNELILAYLKKAVSYINPYRFLDLNARAADSLIKSLEEACINVNKAQQNVKEAEENSLQIEKNIKLCEGDRQRYENALKEVQKNIVKADKEMENCLKKAEKYVKGPKIQRKEAKKAEKISVENLNIIQKELEQHRETQEKALKANRKAVQDWKEAKQNMKTIQLWT